MKFLPKTIDSQFLVRIIRNEVSSEEKEFFEEWLQESEEHKEEFSSLLLLWDKFEHSHSPSLPDPEKQWNNIETAISNSRHSYPDAANYYFPGQKYPAAGKKVQRGGSSIWLFRIAAVLVISISIFFAETIFKENTFVSVPEIKKAPSENIKFYTLSTKRGEKATLKLSDGSVIQLNSDSWLKYPNYFGADSREVEFEGEGYFKINKDEGRPFRVKCNNTLTEVTGTEFNIKNRANDLSITVVEGSVKTFSKKEKEGIAVTRGEMVRLKSSGDFSRPLKVDLKHLTAWRENKISFSKTPLSAAAEELERCYSSIDIIIISDSLKQKTITGVFDTNSLDEILSVFTLAMDIRISKKGNIIYFE